MIFIRRQPVPPFHTNFSPCYAAWHAAHQFSPKEPQAHKESTSSTKTNKDNDESPRAETRDKNQERCTVIGRDARLVEEDGAYSISIDLPGVKPSDASIELEGNIVKVEAKRTTGSNACSKKYTKQFRVNEKSIELSGLTACISDGVLTIKAPKKAPTEPLTIQILPEYPPEESSNKRALATLDVPGVKLDDMKVVFHDDIVEVQGERTRGRLASKIQRRFGADGNKIDVSTLQAYLADGVLTVTGLVMENSKKTEKKSVLVTTRDDTAAVPHKNEEVVATKEED